MRPLLLLLLTITVPLAAQQSDSEDRDEQSSQSGEQRAEEAPPGPSIREQNGVIVIGSSPRSAQPQQPAEPAGSGDGAEAGAPARDAATAEDPVADEAAPPPSAPQTPTRTNRRIQVFNISGNPVEITIVSDESTSATGGQKTQTLQSISKREVPYLSEREEIVSQTKTAKTVERTTQRYDAEGNPTRQEMIREEVKKLPDGTIVTTATTFVENINGRMEAVERTVSREKESGNRIQRTVTVERPSINGGYQTYTREESVETRQGDASAQIETVRKVDNGGGRLIESGREETVMSQSGDTATTEKIVWERDGLTSKMVEASKTVGTLITRADRSSTGDGRDLCSFSGRRLGAFLEFHAAGIGSDCHARDHDWVQRRDDRNQSHPQPESSGPQRNGADKGGAESPASRRGWRDDRNPRLRANRQRSNAANSNDRRTGPEVGSRAAAKGAKSICPREWFVY